ncbi:MAG TPA: hypothetical protein VEI97_03860 [bacterium]|nr:hypothetical protein [bacterium]
MPTPSERPIATRLFELFADAPKFTHDQSAKMLQHGWNGVYVMFEEGQTLSDGRLRLTRIGSHREPRELKRRLEENAQTGKMGQVGFRRQVASAIMQRAGVDLPTIQAAVSQKTFPHHIDVKVTDYLRQHCSYTVIVTGRDLDRLFGKDTPWLELEKRLVGQLAYALPRPTEDWLGSAALDKKIREAGLWNTTNLTAGWTRGTCAADEELLEYVMDAFQRV